MIPRPRLGSGQLAALLIFCHLVAGCASSQAEADEAADIVRLLGLESGDRVADVGAGDGEWTLPLAEKVGPGGHVWATEVSEEKVEELRRDLRDEGWPQIEVVLGDQASLGLPEDCCDAILLRLVYHHFTDPAAMQQDLISALKPGARLLVIDIRPQTHWAKLDDVPERGGHGITLDELVGDLAGRGFRELERHDKWRDNEERYAVLFLAP